MSVTPEEFRALLMPIMEQLAGKRLDAALAAELNRAYPPSSATFQAIKRACQDAIEAGWMCNREAGGIKFGRVVKPAPDTGGFSVDVVHMCDVRGPHHRHPNGEVDLVLPLTGSARFDGHGAGWVVYPPDSAHHPTVTGGDALVLYLLPDGAIEFTGA
jgi:hypothetical protein